MIPQMFALNASPRRMRSAMSADDASGLARAAWAIDPVSWWNLRWRVARSAAAQCACEQRRIAVAPLQQDEGAASGLFCSRRPLRGGGGGGGAAGWACQ